MGWGKKGDSDGGMREAGSDGKRRGGDEGMRGSGKWERYWEGNYLALH